jgi:hypothetical protein
MVLISRYRGYFEHDFMRVQASDRAFARRSALSNPSGERLGALIAGKAGR